MVHVPDVNPPMMVQFIPPADDVTVPEPEPDPVPVPVTVIGNVGTPKLATTLSSPFIVTTQVPVPEQPAPLQPVKVKLPEGVAVNVTAVPAWNDALQTLPPPEPLLLQLIPAGTDVTLPVPPVPPVNDTESVNIVSALNVAVTVIVESMVTTQVPVPEQPPPLQPAKIALAPGVAVSVTMVPTANWRVQSNGLFPMPVGHLIEPGEEAT